MNDEWCYHCDEERIIGLWCPGTFQGEPCNTVWLNLADREDCPRCGETLDYLRVDDDLKCAEHRDEPSAGDQRDAFDWDWESAAHEEERRLDREHEDALVLVVGEDPTTVAVIA